MNQPFLLLRFPISRFANLTVSLFGQEKLIQLHFHPCRNSGYSDLKAGRILIDGKADRIKTAAD